MPLKFTIERSAIKRGLATFVWTFTISHCWKLQDIERIEFLKKFRNTESYGRFEFHMVIRRLFKRCTLRKNAIESKEFFSKSMYIMDSNQYAIELVTYLLVLVVYFYESIVYMLLERNAFDSIAFFSQCMDNLE